VRFPGRHIDQILCRNTSRFAVLTALMNASRSLRPERGENPTKSGWDSAIGLFLLIYCRVAFWSSPGRALQNKSILLCNIGTSDYMDNVCLSVTTVVREVCGSTKYCLGTVFLCYPAHHNELWQMFVVNRACLTSDGRPSRLYYSHSLIVPALAWYTTRTLHGLPLTAWTILSSYS